MILRIFAGLVLLTLTATDVRWTDLPVNAQEALTSRRIDAARFPGWLRDIRAANDARLRDGNYDHLVHYALQSTRVTTLPPIEPALSAKAFVESKSKQIPHEAQARLTAFASALSKSGGNGDARMAHFREVTGGLRGAALETRLMREYERAMRFLYEKEFVAGRTSNSAAAVASLYQTRGHSSDTEIEAGYAVYVALATLKQLEPKKTIARVLIVGPGLDLAPRTALLEAANPQSYQPFAIADALRGLGMTSATDVSSASRAGAGAARAGRANTSGAGAGAAGASAAGVAGRLRIDAVDLNPHVASAIERAVRAPELTLHVTSGIADTDRTRFTEDYRAYLASFGRAIGSTHDEPDARGHVRKTITIAPDVRAAIHASRLDIVTERLVDATAERAADRSADRTADGAADGPVAGAGGYDLVVVTNVFPYFSDPELIVAIANIAAVLAPGGALIHNEPRPLLQSTAASIGLPAIHARSVLIATVPGGQDLYDAIWIHRKR